jgi:hypothetical protein
MKKVINPNLNEPAPRRRANAGAAGAKEKNKRMGWVFAGAVLPDELPSQRARPRMNPFTITAAFH